MTTSTPLNYTPRALAQVPDTAHFVVLESDPDTMPSSTQKSILAQNKSSNYDRRANGTEKDSDAGSDAAMETDEQDHDGAESDSQPAKDQPNPRMPGTWASSISIVDPTAQKVLKRLELGKNEAALSCCFAPIESQDSEAFLFVGTGQNMSVMPRKASAGYVHLYRVRDSAVDGQSGQPVEPEFEFIHKTKFSQLPQALAPFQGRLLVGVGRHVCIYDVGMRQLLRKSWRPRVTTYDIVSIDSQASRIIVTDQKESVTYLKYDHTQNGLVPFADDVCARWSTCATMVDYETVAGGDKFGNLFVLRCPKSTSEDVDQENGALMVQHLKPFLGGAPQRLELAAHFFLNDIPMGIHKTQLQPGGLDILVWTGLQGTIGAIVPFAMHDDAEFFMTLEKCMRLAEPSMIGRDHLLYRSYYVPQKSCVDGDKIERFFLLNDEWKQRISNEVEKSIPEIEKKIVDMRMRSAF